MNVVADADEPTNQSVTEIMHFALEKTLAYNNAMMKSKDNTVKRKSADFDYNSPEKESAHCYLLSLDNVPEFANLKQIDHKAKHKRQRPGNSPTKFNSKP